MKKGAKLSTAITTTAGGVRLRDSSSNWFDVPACHPGQTPSQVIPWPVAANTY